MKPEAGQRELLLVMDSAYPSTGGGGAEHQAGTLGRWLNASGWPCTLVVPMTPDQSRLPLEVMGGLPVVRIDYPRIRKIGALVLYWRVFMTIWRGRHRTSAIYAHIGSWMAVVCCLAGKLCGQPVLVKMTGDTELKGGALDPKGGLSARLKRFGLGYATGYQATSSQIEKAIVSAGLPPGRVHRIANAVNLDRFVDTSPDPETRRRVCPDSAFVALYVGRLEPVKGLDVLLEGWARALGDDRAAWLVLVGTGSQEGALRSQAQRLDIDARVVFAGHIEKVEHFMAWADVAVLPSWREGLSNSMLECMAAGLPMLGSRVSGTDDFVVPGRTGWLFEPGDVAGLAASLRTARTAGPAHWRALGAAAQAQVVAQASLPAVATRLLRLLAQEPNDTDRFGKSGGPGGRRCAGSRG